MRTANPALGQQALNRLAQTPVAAMGLDRFTAEGAVTKTALLLALTVASAAVSWAVVPRESVRGFLIAAMLVGLVIAFVTFFKPNIAHITGPIYALVEGVAVGLLSGILGSQYEGIVGQAVIGTFGTLAVMLVLYRTGVIKVTQRFRSVLFAATGAILLTYLITFVLGLFGINVGFIRGNSMLSIGISIVIIGVAALNLVLDFDFIENAQRAGLPKRAEWYAAFGLIVTLIWLYLEILRLLAKVQSRR